MNKMIIFLWFLFKETNQLCTYYVYRRFFFNLFYSLKIDLHFYLLKNHIVLVKLYVREYKNRFKVIPESFGFGSFIIFAHNKCIKM